MLPITFASLVMNLLPTAGAGGAALFMNDAARRKKSPSRTAAGLILVQIADFGIFMFVLSIGLVYLFIRHDLKLYEVIGALLLFMLTSGLTGVLLTGMWYPNRLYQFLGFLQQHINQVGGWFHRPQLLTVEWIDKSAEEFTEAAQAITTYPQRLISTLLVSLAVQVVNLTSLYTLFRAFQQPIGVGTLIAGYTMGVLFWNISLLAQGIGVVEGIMTLVYTSLGIPTENAIVIALAFRGLSFWIPLMIGFFSLRRLKTS